MAQPPPAAPTSQAQHPESATTAVLGASPSHQSPENEIDSLLYSFHQHIRQSSSAVPDRTCASISQLYDQLDSQSRIVLDEELPYEDTPSDERRVRLDVLTTQGRSWLQSCKLAQQRIAGQELSIIEQPEDGLVLVSHIVEASPAPVMSWSLGFLVKTSEGNTYAISCSHTLESAAHRLRKHADRIAASSSSTFLTTRSGHLLPVTSIVSSLPLHDLVIYAFSSASPPPGESLRTVPVALYPPQIGTEQSLYTVGSEEWRKSKIIGYKDSRGNDAEVGALPGTYDELTSISIDVIPTPGSSGGPLVSSNGAVTGLVRGSRMAFGDRRSAGFATPAEKIFEMFQLPGLPRTKQK